MAYLFSQRQRIIIIPRNMGCMEFSTSCCTVIDDTLYLRRVSQGISAVSQRESSHFFCMMWIVGWLWSQCKGNWPHLNLNWGTLSYFGFLRGHQCASRLVTVFLGTLWSSIKQIKAPYLFDWGGGIALHTMQGNQFSSLTVREVSWFFSRCSGNLGYISIYGGDGHSKLVFVQRCQDSCLVMMDTSGI